MAAQRPVFARSVLAHAGVDQAGSAACGGGGGGGGATARVKGSAISACERSGLRISSCEQTPTTVKVESVGMEGVGCWQFE